MIPLRNCTLTLPSVTVPVVLIGHMRMRMPQRQMAVAMIVGAKRHRDVVMRVMPVVMRVRMLMFHIFMLMRMRMVFG